MLVILPFKNAVASFNVPQVIFRLKFASLMFAGGGKTVIFGAILKCFDGRFPTVVLTRNRSLVEQVHGSFSQSDSW